MPKRSDFEFRQESAMSQQLADKDPDYVELAGTDPDTSIAIGILKELGKQGYIDLTQPSMILMLGLLNIRRKALFATSERTNEITKMGLQMPKKTKEVNMSERG